MSGTAWVDMQQGLMWVFAPIINVFLPMVLYVGFLSAVTAGLLAVFHKTTKGG